MDPPLDGKDRVANVLLKLLTPRKGRSGRVSNAFYTKLRRLKKRGSNLNRRFHMLGVFDNRPRLTGIKVLFFMCARKSMYFLSPNSFRDALV